tara:strand:+ start:505 stop:681 length:177 start_codon:yes stop_codon:yes gene_type:complete
MNNQDKITQLETQLRAVLSAYNILEEYCCLLVGSDCDENETITEANEIVNKSLNNQNK